MFEGIKDNIKKFFTVNEQNQSITPSESKESMPDLDYMTERFLLLMENTSYDLLPDSVDFNDFLKEMAKDPDIETELKNFKSFVTQGRISFSPANEKAESVRAAEICTQVLSPDVLKKFYDKAMHCLEQGFSVVWAKFMQSGGFSSIDKFQETEFENIDFNGSGELINRWTYEVLNQPNWIITTYNQRYEDKHGRSILLPLYWVVKFEKLGIKQIVTLMDKFGVPSFAALIQPSGDNETDRKRANAIASAIKNIRSHSGVALTANDIKKLEAQSGSITEIKDFIVYLQDKKTRVIMGTLLMSGTTQNSGTYNLSENHKTITENRVKDVGELIAESITKQLVPLICRLNINQFFNPDNMPKAVYSLPIYSGLDDFLKVIDKFENVEVKAATVKNVYKMPIENPDDDVLVVRQSSRGGSGVTLSEQQENIFDNFFFQKMKNKNSTPQTHLTDNEQTNLPMN